MEQHSEIQSKDGSTPEVEAAGVNEFALKGFPARFADPQIEGEFHQSEYDGSKTIRIISYSTGVAMLLPLPFVKNLMFSQAPALLPYFMVGAFAIQLPTFLFAMWFSLKQVSWRIAGIVQMAIAVVIEIDAEYFRLLCTHHGMPFPSSVTLLGFSLPLLLFGIPIRLGLSSMVLFFIASRGLELIMLGGSPQFFAEISADLVFVILTIVAVIRLDASRRQSYSRLSLSERRAYIDQLTGLLNRWGFQRDAERILRQAVRDKHPVTLVAIDVDHFKSINDSAGHAFGDFVLAQIGACLGKAGRRPLDVTGRIGGEEFVLLFYAPRDDFSTDIGKYVITSIRALGLQRPDNPSRVITASAGVATLVPRGDPDELQQLMELADRYLYQAKAAGRDTYSNALAPAGNSPA